MAAPHAPPGRLLGVRLGVIVLTLAACDGDSGAPDAESPEMPAAEIARNCQSAVYGKLRPDVRKAAVAAGPLALLVEDGGGAAAFEPSAIVKVLALVRTGERLTLSVPDAERRRLSLLYDLSTAGPRRPLRLSDGTSSVRFSACTRSEEWSPGQPYPEPRETQFNGALIVRGAHCASLEVWVEGQAQPMALGVPFGTGDRACTPVNAG
jgi:hypothetical protein